MKTVEPLRKHGKRQLVLEQAERAYVGVDVHKVSWSVALWTAQRGIVAQWSQPADAQTLITVLEPVAAQVAEVVYEAGPTGFGLVRSLRAAGFKAEVCSPSKRPVFPGKQPKSDGLDCRALAAFAGKGLLSMVRVPSCTEEDDRQVLRRRGQVSGRLTEVKNEIKSFLLLHGIAEPVGLKDWSRKALASLAALELRSAEQRFCLDDLLDELAGLQAREHRLRQRLAELSRQERHAADIRLLRQVGGIGLLSALTFKLELADPRRFSHEGQVSRYLGLAPLIRQSGGTLRQGGVLKSGNARVRAILVEAAWRHIRLDPGGRARYARLVRNTAQPKKAIVAVARQLGIVLWRLLITAQPYRVAPAA